MAKEAGSTRVSHWGSGSDYIGDLYFYGSKRVEYKDLPDGRKDAVKRELKKVQKEMWALLKDKKTPQFIDGKPIEISYIHKDLDDAARDMMMLLSGKYFSRQSMLNIDKSLEKAIYIPTDHRDTENRPDGRKLWFRYSDGEGRGVYFSVTRIPDGRYAFHSVTDKLPDKNTVHKQKR